MEMIFLSAAMRHAPDPPASPLEPATVPYHPLVATSQAHISLWFYLAAFNTRNTFFEMFSCLGSLALALPFPRHPFQSLPDLVCPLPNQTSVPFPFFLGHPANSHGSSHSPGLRLAPLAHNP